MTAQQTKFIVPVDMVIFSMFPGSDTELTAYLNQLLRAIEPKLRSNVFWFPTPKTLGRTEDFTRIETGILKEIQKLKAKEKPNLREDAESIHKILERLDQNTTMLTETEREAIDDILVEYNDRFARHRTDIGMNLEFEVQITPKGDIVVYNHRLQIVIHSKRDLNIELVVMHSNGIMTVPPCSSYASPILAQWKPNGKLRPHVG